MQSIYDLTLGTIGLSLSLLKVASFLPVLSTRFRLGFADLIHADISINAEGITMPKLPIKKQSVELKFMDIKVKLEGQKDIEKKALKLLSGLVKDRLRVFEVLAEIDHEDEHAELKNKNKKPKADINFMLMYQ